MNTKKFLKVDAPEYLELAEGDKKALVHLCKSGAILENIHLRIDCIHNLPFKAFLEEEIKKGNKQAELTKILFDAQKGIHALDRLSNKIHLIKGLEEYPGKGVYPEDLTKEEFHSIIKTMVEENKIEEEKKF